MHSNFHPKVLLGIKHSLYFRMNLRINLFLRQSDLAIFSSSFSTSVQETFDFGFGMNNRANGDSQKAPIVLQKTNLVGYNSFINVGVHITNLTSEWKYGAILILIANYPKLSDYLIAKIS
jgi:hypothetical protein